jgi:YHYH protein/Secretion system C-terminal sorting domain
MKIMKQLSILKKLSFVIICLITFCNSQAQTDPMITSWWFNTTNQTYVGTNGTFVVNVEAIYYTSSIVYVKSSGVPSYYTDGNSKFDAKDQTNVFKLPRTQTVATTATRTYLRDEGAVAVLIDGSVALSPGDGKSYNNAGVWHQLAYKFEGGDFDSNKGHSTPGGQYHHHVDPSPLYTVSASTVHSPIIGYAFDGYPIYGPYGYTNIDGTGAIKRMTSSWAVRNITTRTTLPDGSTASSSGPTIASQALGKYYEDYEYISGTGDLDEYNGRFCVTPEYPSGTYCYFLTLDSSLNPFFPYVIGDYFYGVVQSGNMGPTGGNNTVPGTATLYNSTTLSTDKSVFEDIKILAYPNPFANSLIIDNKSSNNYKINLYNMNGAVVYTAKASKNTESIDLTSMASGNYIIEIIDGATGNGYMTRVIKN